MVSTQLSPCSVPSGELVLIWVIKWLLTSLFAQVPNWAARLTVKKKNNSQPPHHPHHPSTLGGVGRRGESKGDPVPELNQNKRGSVCKEGQQVRARGSPGWGHGVEGQCGLRVRAGRLQG